MVLELVRPDGSVANFCPLIYVDQDASMLRGLLQGWPKKMGSTWITRSYPLDHPGTCTFTVPRRSTSSARAWIAPKIGVRWSTWMRRSSMTVLVSLD